MDHAAALRRLRLTGRLFVGLIIIVSLVQAVALQWRASSAPTRAQQVNDSGIRRTLTMTILYRSTLAGRPDFASSLNEAADGLVTLQQRMGDLGADDAATFNAFISTARTLGDHPNDRNLHKKLETLALATSGAFDRRTKVYVASGNGQGAAFRKAIIGASVATVAVTLLLYFLVIRPRERGVERFVNELEARRERFTAIFDNSSEMMMLYDPEGRLEAANQSALASLRLKFEPDTQTFQSHVAPHSRVQASAEFARARSGRSSDLDLHFVDASGREFPVTGSLSPIIVSGKVAGVAAVARDMTAEQLAEQEIVRSNERFRSLFSRSPNAILAVDADGIISDANSALERLTGYRIDELVGKPLSILVPDGVQAAAETRFTELLAGEPRTYTAPTLTRDGREIMLEVDATPIRVAGRPEGMFYTSREVGRETALQRQLNEKDERLHALLKIATLTWQGGAEIDEGLLLGARALGMPYGVITQFHDGMVTVRHRYGPSDILPVGFTMPMTDAIGGMFADAPRALAIDDMTIEPFTGQMQERGLPWKCLIGSSIVLGNILYGGVVFLDREKHESPFTDGDRDFIDVIGTLMTTAVARNLRTKELEGRATLDTLTGLANRTLLEEQFRGFIARARRRSELVIVYYIDLDRFKPVNDTYGHEAGDEVLNEVAKRFRITVRNEDTVARVGGDEFIVLQLIEKSKLEGNTLARRLTDTLEEPITLSSGAIVTIGASIGTASFPDDGQTLEQLIRASDERMYQDKTARRLAVERRKKDETNTAFDR